MTLFRFAIRLVNYVLGQDTEIGISKRHIKHVSHMSWLLRLSAPMLASEQAKESYVG